MESGKYPEANFYICSLVRMKFGPVGMNWAPGGVTVYPFVYTQLFKRIKGQTDGLHP
jgi:hypothetical protein